MTSIYNLFWNSNPVLKNIIQCVLKILTCFFWDMLHKRLTTLFLFQPLGSIVDIPAAGDDESDEPIDSAEDQQNRQLQQFELQNRTTRQTDSYNKDTQVIEKNLDRLIDLYVAWIMDNYLYSSFSFLLFKVLSKSKAFTSMEDDNHYHNRWKKNIYRKMKKLINSS